MQCTRAAQKKSPAKKLKIEASPARASVLAGLSLERYE